MPRLPHWTKVKLPGNGDYYRIRQKVSGLSLHTVCEEAACPNIAQCWGGGTATFMILGDVCTRGCRFCKVTSGKPSTPPDSDEPEHVASAIVAMELKYAVITSVDRDDCADHGAAHFVATVAAIRKHAPHTTIELLTPDFGGEQERLRLVCESGADVLGHNIETVRVLSPAVRDRRCDYDLSLRVLQTYHELKPTALTKSSIMLGLGEQRSEISQTLQDLRDVGTDWVTLGQYLRPTRKHLPVSRFFSPEEFEELAQEARELGFSLVSSGPLVRSSYRAAEQGAQALLASRRQQETASVSGSQ